MSSSKFKKYIFPLHVNGMDGRMLKLKSPPKRNRNILLIYGHHSSLERTFGIAEVFNRYGEVTVPDLPGFGGMSSFFKIKREPTLDAYADYLASFIKLQYKRKRLTIIATSFSFLIVTRMLQKYPILAKKVDLLISVVGFVHNEDFRFNRLSLFGLKSLSTIFSFRLPALLLRHTAFTNPMIKLAYEIVASSNPKMADSSREEFIKRVKFETLLWQINDVRTRMKTMRLMFDVDLCHETVNLPVTHISVPHDRFINNDNVKQHMLVIFDTFEDIPTNIKGHMPTVVATAKEASPMVPPKVRRLLLKKK